MKVRALTSFVGHHGDDRKMMVVSAGDEFDLPAGVDWVSCGFCEPLEEAKPKRKPRRTAARKAAETAVRSDQK